MTKRASGVSLRDRLGRTFRVATFRGVGSWVTLSAIAVAGVSTGAWNWQAILLVALGIYLLRPFARETAVEVINRWAADWRPWYPNALVPRVWDFHWAPTTLFLSELAEMHRRTELTVVPAFFKWDARENFVTRLRIEEWSTRLRIHQWRVTGPASPAGSAPETYEWDDFRVADIPSGSPHELPIVWAYATESMACVLKVSLGLGAPEGDQVSRYIRLVVWIDRGEPVAVDDVLLTVPLSPEMLDGGFGWSGTSGDGDTFRWRWGIEITRV